MWKEAITGRDTHRPDHSVCNYDINHQGDGNPSLKSRVYQLNKYCVSQAAHKYQNLTINPIWRHDDNGKEFYCDQLYQEGSDIQKGV